MHQLTELNNLITEFYDKMSSWEMSVVKETGYSLAQIHTLEVLGSHGAMRMKELANRLNRSSGKTGSGGTNRTSIHRRGSTFYSSYFD